MTWKSKSGKTKLIKVLVAKGFSYRKAEKAVNAVFLEMARALKRGESVVIPGGTIQVVPSKQKERLEWQPFRNINSKEAFHKTIHYGQDKYRIRFRRDMKLNFPLISQPLPPPKSVPPPTPVPPLSSAELEIRDLFLLITGQPATAQDLVALQTRIDKYPHRPGALLRRLRSVRARRFKFGILRLTNYMEVLWDL